MRKNYLRGLVAGHPEVQARVAAELDTAGLLASPKNPTPRRPTYADLAALPYLDAVLRESLRIMPVSVFMYRETVDPVTDIGGFAVPASTEVMVRAMALGKLSVFSIPSKWSAYVSKCFVCGAYHAPATPRAPRTSCSTVSWVWVIGLLCVH